MMHPHKPHHLAMSPSNLSMVGHYFQLGICAIGKKNRPGLATAHVWAS